MPTDTREARFEQRVADRAHVDRPRRAADEVGPLERLGVDGIGARRRQQRTAGGIAPS